MSNQSRHLEIQQIRLAAAKTDVEIARAQFAIAAMRRKQLARAFEIERQEALATEARSA